MDEFRNSSALTLILRARFAELPKDYFHKLQYPKLPDDLKVGASEIGTCVYGPGKQRKIYHLWKTRPTTLALMPHGSQMAARLSTIKSTFWSRERAAFPQEQQEDLVRLHILLTQILLLTAPGSDLADAVRDDANARALCLEALRMIVKLIH